MPRAPFGREALLRGLIEKKAQVLLETTKVALPEVVVPELDDLVVEVPPAPAIDEADVVLAFDELRREHAKVTERAPGERTELGDEVELDVIAYHEGRVVPFSVRSGLVYTLGEDLFWPGLSDGVVGTPVGEAAGFALTLPDDGWAEAWRGRTVQVACTVRAARRVDKPAADDPAFLAATGRGRSLDEVTASLARDLLDDREEERVDFARGLVLDAVLARCTFKVPRELVDEEIRQRFRRAEGDTIARWGLSSDEQKQALEGWLDDAMTFLDAEHRVAAALVLGAVAREVGLTVTDEDVADFVEATAEALGGDVGAARESLLAGDGGPDEAVLKDRLLYLVALEYLVARAEVRFLD